MTSPPGYVPLMVPEPLYLRCLTFLATADTTQEVPDFVSDEVDRLRDESDRLRGVIAELQNQLAEATRRADREASHYDQLAPQFDAQLAEISDLRNLWRDASVDLPGGLAYYDTLLAQREKADRPAAPEAPLEVPVAPVSEPEIKRYGQAAKDADASAVKDAFAQRFVATMTEAAPGVLTRSSEFWAAFQEWAQRQPDAPEGMTPRRIGQAVTAAWGKAKPRTDPQAKGGSSQQYLGVRLKTAQVPQEPPSPEPAPVVPTEPEALTAHVDAIAEKAQAIQQDLRDSLGMRGRQGRKELPKKRGQRLQVVKDEPEYPRTEAIKIARLRDNTAEVAPASGWRWADGREAPPEWDKIKDWDLEALAIDMVAICREGLPAEVPYLIRDDVLALEGFDESEVESALRHPERVTVRPETQDRDKRYPVLSFRRGDVNVILGTQHPEKPAVIACYWTSLLMGYDPTYHRDRTGGGGSKQKASIPTTAKALTRRLQALGAHVKEDPAGLTATVTYDGQDLGKINLGERLPKTTVENDWQRTQRRIHAIDQRSAKVGGR